MERYQRCDSKREKTLSKKNDAQTGGVVGQDDLWSCNHEARRLYGRASKKRSQTERPVTRRHCQNPDDRCTRSLALRPKDVRMQGRSPSPRKRTAREQSCQCSPEERCQKRTDWNPPRPIHALELRVQEKKHLIGTGPISTGIRDARDSTRSTCHAPPAQSVTRTSRPEEGLRAQDRLHKLHATADTGWNCPARHTQVSC